MFLACFCGCTILNDTFNRADENPVVGPYADPTGWEIVSNACRTNTNNAKLICTRNPIVGNALVVVSLRGAANTQFKIYVNFKDNSNHNYVLLYKRPADDGLCTAELHKVVGGSDTLLNEGSLTWDIDSTTWSIFTVYYGDGEFGVIDNHSTAVYIKNQPVGDGSLAGIGTGSIATGYAEFDSFRFDKKKKQTDVAGSETFACTRPNDNCLIASDLHVNAGGKQSQTPGPTWTLTGGTFNHALDSGIWRRTNFPGPNSSMFTRSLHPFNLPTAYVTGLIKSALPGTPSASDKWLHRIHLNANSYIEVSVTSSSPSPPAVVRAGSLKLFANGSQVGGSVNVSGFVGGNIDHQLSICYNGTKLIGIFAPNQGGFYIPTNTIFNSSISITSPIKPGASCTDHTTTLALHLMEANRVECVGCP